MLLKQYDTDFFNIKPDKPKKLKLGTQQGDGDTPDGTVWQEPDSTLPKESDVKPADMPDDFVHNYIMPTIGGVMKFFGGEKTGKMMWDGVTNVVSAIQPSQREELEGMGKAMYGTQEWVEVQNEEQLASPEIKKATGNATASNASGVMTGAEAKRNDVWDAQHLASKFVLTPEGKADMTRKFVTGNFDSVVKLGGDEVKAGAEAVKKAGGIDAGVNYADEGVSAINSVFGTNIPKVGDWIPSMYPDLSKAPQVRKRLKQDLGSGMNAFSKWR